MTDDEAKKLEKRAEAARAWRELTTFTEGPFIRAKEYALAHPNWYRSYVTIPAGALDLPAVLSRLEAMAEGREPGADAALPDTDWKCCYKIVLAERDAVLAERDKTHHAVGLLVQERDRLRQELDTALQASHALHGEHEQVVGDMRRSHEVVCRHVDALKQELAEAKAYLTEAHADLSAYRKAQSGDGQRCYYCNEQCHRHAGNPGRWPIAMAHADEPGVVKYHHVDCVERRLNERDALRAQLCKGR